MSPHQVDAALFALSSPLTRGVLLADEVGLGKTIKAALVIAQKQAERRRRILLIVPASLRKQWSQELFDKFSLPSIIIEAKSRASGVLQIRSTRPGCHHILRIGPTKAEDVARGRWDLVVLACGETRMEALAALEIPAILVEASIEGR